MKNLKVHLTMAIATTLVASPMAISAEENWYITPALNYVIADSDRNADDGLGLMLGVGKKLNEKWNIEASIISDKLDFSNSSGSYDQLGLVFDGLYFFNRNADFTPYMVVGAGALQTDSGVADKTNLMVNVGLGLEKKITNSGMGLRGDIRYRLDNDSSSVSSQDRFGDLIVGLTLKVPFGGEKAKPVAVAAPVVAAPVVAKPVILDSDADGVVDSKDRCPTSAANATVDKNGCEVIILKGVNFESNSSKLKASSIPVLDAAAATLKQRGDIKVQVAGHTDSQGAAAYNQTLSAARANTVREYLIAKGVNADNLSAKGFGEEMPITTNSTATGRATNRRVELRIQ